MLQPLPIAQIIRAAGGQSKIARRFGIQRQAVNGWRRVPAERALLVAEMSGLPLHKIRPDLYPPSAAASDINMTERAPSVRDSHHQQAAE